MNEDMRVMPITLFRCIYCSLWTDFTHYYSVSVINCEQRMQTLFMQWHQPIFHALCLPTVGRLLPRVYWHFRQIYLSSFSKNPTICKIFFAKSQIRKCSGPKERVDGGKSDVFICWNLLISTRMIGKSSCKYFNS